MAECGTTAGFSRHRRMRETICEPCREAHRARERERYWEKKGMNAPPRRGYRKAKCGTTAGDKAHRDRGEKPCENCLQARAEYQRRSKMPTVGPTRETVAKLGLRTDMMGQVL